MSSSDRGANFLSELVSQVCQLTGMKKLIQPHTTHKPMLSSKNIKPPYWQVFTHTLLNMAPSMAVTCATFCLPTESTPRMPYSYQVDTDDYTTKLMDGLSTAWKNARLEV